MTINVLVATTWNNVGGLAVMPTQPAYELGQVGKFDPAISGAAWVQSPYYEFVYQPRLYQTLWFAALASVGLNIDSRIYAAKITIQIPQEQNGGTLNFNAWARIDPSKWNRTFNLWKASIFIVTAVQI